jgi:hypothetical protein
MVESGWGNLDRIVGAIVESGHAEGDSRGDRNQRSENEEVNRQFVREVPLDLMPG